MDKTTISMLPPLITSNQATHNHRTHSRKRIEPIGERPPLRPVLGQNMNPRGTMKRKENKNGVNPLKCINKIIDDCEEAVQNYDEYGSKKRTSHSQITRNSLNTTTSEEKSNSRANSQNKSKINKGEAENFQSRRLSSNSCLGPKKSVKLTGDIHGITNDQLKRLYEAKCMDLKKKSMGEQQRRFIEYCSKVIQNRKITLNEVFFFKNL